MKFRNLLALAATTATLALAPIAHADNITGNDPDPATGHGAPIAKNISFAKIIYTVDGLYTLPVTYSIATSYVPEEDYIYLGDKAGRVYQCHNYPATTALANLTCDVYGPKK